MEPDRDRLVGARCPACHAQALKASPPTVDCTACGASYPRLAGIPWLFREPQLLLGDWQNRLTLYLEEFRHAALAAEAALAGPEASPAARRRLEQLSRGYRGQAEQVETLLEPLALRALPAPRATMNGFAVRVPRHQDLHSYYVNLHRDWLWGDAENAQALAAVRSVMPAAAAEAIVLGAGGCRLAYDLHQLGRLRRTVALDINPLLLLTANELLSGRAVKLHEFPIAPRSDADHAIERTLRPPVPPRPGLELVFGDALDAPFVDAAFDIVVTPWLIDIIDDPFAHFAARVNRLLGSGGTWINFGSVSFAALEPGLRIGPAELREQLGAAGFEVTGWEEREIPYMRSPASRHSRKEVVLTFAARKINEVAAPRAALVLPPWLRDPRVAIPLSTHFEATGVASRLQAVALALVDGRRCAADIAAFLVEQQLLGPEAALAAVRGLLLRVYEAESRHPPRG